VTRDRLAAFGIALAAAATLGGGLATAATGRVGRLTGPIAKANVVSNTDTVQTSSKTWVDVPGGATAVNIPDNHTALLLIRYTAESSCGADGYCSMRVLVDGAEADPLTGTTFAFDSPGDGPEATSMDRMTGRLAAGTHLVKLQFCIVQPSAANPSNVFALDDSMLTVEVAYTS
jgi:hypothetical protein